MIETILYLGKREYAVNCKSVFADISFLWSTVEGIEDAQANPDFPNPLPRSYVTLSDRSIYISEPYDELCEKWETYLIKTI